MSYYDPYRRTSGVRLGTAAWAQARWAPQNLISSRLLSITQEAFTDTVASMVISDTLNWITLSQGTITLTQKDMAIDIYAQALLSHSANAATAGLRVILYEVDGITPVVFTQQDPVYLATLNQNYPLTLVQSIRASSAFSQLVIGRHIVKLQMRNHTAGNLTAVTTGTFAETFVMVQAIGLAPSTVVTSGAPTSAVGTAVAIGAGSIQNAPSWNQSAHIFTMADGNYVAVYFDGTNMGYRVKNVLGWGNFTALTNDPTHTDSAWTRNGDDLYGATTGSGGTCRVHKLAYSAGAITQTSTSVISGAGTPSRPAIYFDTTNSFVHLFENDGVTPVTMFCYNTSLVAQYNAAGTGTYNITAGTILVGDGTSTFFLYSSPGGSAHRLERFVAGASSYTTSFTAETGIPGPAAAIAGLGAAYDGTDIVLFYQENNAKIRTCRRTALNTFSAMSDLVTATLGTSTSVAAFRKGTAASSDLVIFFRNNTNQANGEIYYARRISGTWDASPGTRLVGNAATGWSNVSAAGGDLNALGIARVVYVTGTANPFTVAENSLTV